MDVESISRPNVKHGKRWDLAAPSRVLLLAQQITLSWLEHYIVNTFINCFSSYCPSCTAELYYHFPLEIIGLWSYFVFSPSHTIEFCTGITTMGECLKIPFDRGKKASRNSVAFLRQVLRYFCNATEDLS